MMVLVVVKGDTPVMRAWTVSMVMTSCGKPWCHAVVPVCHPRSGQCRLQWSILETSNPQTRSEKSTLSLCWYVSSCCL